MSLSSLRYMRIYCREEILVNLIKNWGKRKDIMIDNRMYRLYYDKYLRGKELDLIADVEVTKEGSMMKLKIMKVRPRKGKSFFY